MTQTKQTRFRSSPQEHEWVENFLSKNVYVRSGDHIERLPWSRWEDVHAAYVNEVKQSPFPVRSYTFVRSIARQMNIHLSRFDKYQCTVCWVGLHPDDKTLPNAKKLLKEYPEHRRIVDSQSALYHEFKAKAENTDTDVLVIFDYTRFHETTEKIHDLGVVLICKKGIFYTDYVASASHTYDYTVTALQDFFTTNEYVRASTVEVIRIFSDGGLRTKENMYFFSLMQEQLGIAIEVYIFAPQHGHSLADTHFGVGKRSLRFEFAGRCLAGIENVAKQFDGLLNTTVKQLDVIPTIGWNVKPIEAIRSYYAFCFPARGMVACWRFYGSTEPDHFQEFELIDNTKRVAVIEWKESDWNAEDFGYSSYQTSKKESGISKLEESTEKKEVPMEIDLTSNESSVEREIPKFDDWIRRLSTPTEKLTDFLVEYYLQLTTGDTYDVGWLNHNDPQKTDLQTLAYVVGLVNLSNYLLS